MPTVDELNAGVAAVKKKLPALVGLVPDRNIPFVGNLHQLMIAELQSKEATPVELMLVRAVLEAAEEVRATTQEVKL